MTSCDSIVSEQVRVSVFAFLFYKGNKKLVPRALLSYISTWEFLRTLEKCEKHSPAARASLVFLKIPATVLIQLDNAHGAFLNSLLHLLHWIM